MVAAFNERDSADPFHLDTDQELDNTTLEDSEELFSEDATDELDNIEGAPISEIVKTCEDDHRDAFTGWKRTSCFVHTLQLVVKVFETAPSYRNTVKKALANVKKVNKSCKATERLIQLAQLKLTKKCPTRWDSLFVVLCRMLKVKEHLNTVLEELEWDSLNSTQWKHLSSIETLLEPFAHQNVTSSEKSTSIAMVVPVLKELELHLKQVCVSIIFLYIDLLL